MLNKDIHNIFEQYVQLYEQQNIGNLIGATSGGEGGNWGGSLPKLISILPMGNWNASSQKRTKTNTASGHVSDHFQGNSIAYAADFGLNTTFNSNTNSATDFAIKVARNAGRQVDSWEPFKGNVCTINTADGYRIQIIWQSNVGGNHYDHVHVGVKRTGATPFQPTEQQKETETQDTNKEQPQQNSQQDTVDDSILGVLMGKINDIYNKSGGFSANSAKEALKTAVGAGMDMFDKYSKK